MSERREYTEEFNQEPVQLSEKREDSIAEVARGLGIKPNFLYQCWDEVCEKGPKRFQETGRKVNDEKRCTSSKRSWNG